MKLLDMLAAVLDADSAALLRRDWMNISEIRMRANRRMSIRHLDGSEAMGSEINVHTVRRIACMLMENSIYAREDELKEGYFTAEGGCRVGVCGKIAMDDGRITAMSAIGSLCIRIPRQVMGCGKSLLPLVKDNLLILSPPCMGKTTVLRDIARLASDSGLHVAVADERREICACVDGVPQLDVGMRTDVMEGCPKALAIAMLIRSCAPQLIIADEIGSQVDAGALMDASRCGVSIAATAHAACLSDALDRPVTGELLRDGIFQYAAVLGGSPGKILEIRNMKAEADK